MCCEHWKKLSWPEEMWVWTSVAELQQHEFSNVVFLSLCLNHWTSRESRILLNLGRIWVSFKEEKNNTKTDRKQTDKKHPKALSKKQKRDEAIMFLLIHCEVYAPTKGHPGVVSLVRMFPHLPYPALRFLWPWGFLQRIWTALYYITVLSLNPAQVFAQRKEMWCGKSLCK